jgi:hypothetical protein
MHADGLDLGSYVSRRKYQIHPRPQGASRDTANSYNTLTPNLHDIVQRKPQRILRLEM